MADELTAARRAYRTRSPVEAAISLAPRRQDQPGFQTSPDTSSGDLRGALVSSLTQASQTHSGDLTDALSIIQALRAGGPVGGSQRPSAPQAPARTPSGGTGLIAALARKMGVDPAAALAVASQEGLGGGIGDGGTSFGPWQEHRGGALPANIGRQGAAQAQAWAWSPAGIEHALRQISKVSHGLHGRAAIEAIVRRFERPRNPGREIAGASQAYGRYRR